MHAIYVHIMTMGIYIPIVIIWTYLFYLSVYTCVQLAGIAGILSTSLPLVIIVLLIALNIISIPCVMSVC